MLLKSSGLQNQYSSMFSIHYHFADKYYNFVIFKGKGYDF